MEEKSAFITILGRANVGKSSLLNRIVGEKISIVSSKPQTTRTRIMGVVTNNETQLVFIDTPGFHKPHNLLGENMIKAVKDSMCDIDAAILVVDALPEFKIDKGLPPAEIALADNLKKSGIKTVLAINKIDRLAKKDELFEIINCYKDLYAFDEIVPVSAKNGSGVELLVSLLFKYAKPAKHFFSSDDITDQPDSVMVSEIIREKALRTLSKEVPHGIAVNLEKFFEHDTKDGLPIIEIAAVIFCEKNSHKGIIIGKGGETLKNIGSSARIELEKFFGTKVNLKIWVKVKEDWRNRPSDINSFGLLSD
ncbi:MAG: GTPase Era [Clostridia bacterium]|nr:GTPase Era [Clostridia bacterium]